MKNVGYGIMALFLVGMIATTGFVSAYGSPEKDIYFDSERHEIMEQAFDNLDYQAWVLQMNGKGRVLDVINEDNFATFAKVHEARFNDDMETVDRLRAELGLGQKNGQGRDGTGSNHNMRQGNKDGSGNGNREGSRSGNRDGSMHGQGLKDGSGERQVDCPYN